MSTAPAVQEKNQSTALTIGLQQAITNITAQFPEEAKKIQAALAKDIRYLGDDEFFVIRDGIQAIKAFKRKLTFSVSDGTAVKIGGPVIITAVGYERWQMETGATVIFPDTVIVDGRPVPNPAPIRDPNNRRIMGYYCRVKAWGFSPLGSPISIDWVSIYDTATLRMQDLLGSAKNFPQAFRLLPVNSGPPEEKGAWGSYPFDETMNLWVDASHREALKLYGSITNREIHAAAKVQTVARRNALKHLSGLQHAPIIGEREEKWTGDNGRQYSKKVPVFAETWTVPAVFWRSLDGSPINHEKIFSAHVQRVSALLPGNGDQKTGTEMIEPTEQETTYSEVEPGPDEGDVYDIEPDKEEGDPAKPAENMTENMTKTHESETKPALSPEEQKILANYEEAKTQFPDEYEKALSELRAVHNLRVDQNNVTPEVAERVLRMINAIIDRAAG